MLPERLLQRVQFVAGSEPLDSAYPRALGLHREHQAGAHRLVVDQHSAGPADAVLAAQVRAGEATILAQRIGQAAPRLDADRALITVYRESDILFGSSRFAPRLAQQLQHPLRRDRHFENTDAKRCQRIRNCIEHRRRRADRATLADTLGSGDARFG